MSKKRLYNTEEALQIMVELDLDSEIIEKSDDEDPDLSTVAPQSRIGRDFTVRGRFRCY